MDQFGNVRNNFHSVWCGAGSGADYVEIDPTGRYMRYGEIIGRGAYKTVYRGFDAIEGNEVAWSQMRMADFLRSPQTLERTYSEIHLLKHVNHANVMKFYCSWVDDQNKTINIITELFYSGNLRQYRMNNKNADMKALKKWAREILHGLDYLHSHIPPIIHRDLKCDNIFVNGNRGELKIGDLGLAVIMQHGNARSVIGTPEFMAPELYEEEYNELVDIYSFGMCMLELVTFEYPYSECTNPAQIYKKVTSGIKPAALSKVADPELRQFIDKCLLPASERLPAKELLKDSFLQTNKSTDLEKLLQRHNSLHSTVSTVKSDSLSMEIDSGGNLFAAVSGSNLEPPAVPKVEYQRNNRNKEFRLRGALIDPNIIFLVLRIDDLCGSVKNINFNFYLNSDTALSIAGEMVDQLDLPDYDVEFIADFIDFLITKLVPIWKPSTDYTGSCMTRQYKERELDIQVQLAYASPWRSASEAEVKESSSSFFTCTEFVNGCGQGADVNACAANGQGDRVSQGSALSIFFAGASFSECATYMDMGCANDSGQKEDDNVLRVHVDDHRNTDATNSDQQEGPPDEAILRINSMSLAVDEKDLDELEEEVALIKLQYECCFSELSRMRDEALEDARRGWLARKGKC